MNSWPVFVLFCVGLAAFLSSSRSTAFPYIMLMSPECDSVRLSQMRTRYLRLNEFHPSVYVSRSSGEYHKSSVTAYDGTFDLSTLLMIWLKGETTR